MNNLYVPPERTIAKTYSLTRLKRFSGVQYGFKELCAYMRFLDKLDPKYRT